MVLLVAIVKDYRAVEDLLLGFIEAGISGATVTKNAIVGGTLRALRQAGLQ